MNPSHGKALWRALGQRYSPPLQAIVFAGEDVNAVLSIACAVADCFKMKRDVIWCLALPDGDAMEPPIKHVYESVRASRHLVVG